MAIASEYLVEISCLDETGTPTALYLSTSGYVTGPGDAPANRYYDGRIASIGPLVSNIFDSGMTTGERADVGYGEIRLSNADGALDAWLDYAFDGRDVVIKRLASPQAPYTAADTIFTGTIERIDGEDAWTYFRLRIYDRRLSIDRPIQENRYAGTVTGSSESAEGTSDLRGKVKPLVFGFVYNVPAVVVNPFDLIYQVNDGAVNFIQAYDGGVPLVTGGNYTSLANLRNASIAPGGYATCLTLGLFRVGSSPSKDVTADVAEVASGALRRAGSIATRMLGRLGISGPQIDSASTYTLDTAAPYECGIWIEEETTVADAIAQILQSVGAWMVTSALGVYIFGRVVEPSGSIAAIDYDTSIILTDGDQSTIPIYANPDTDGGLPAWRMTVRYQKNWHVQNGAALHGCVSEDDRGFLAREYRERVSESAATKTRHLLSNEMAVPTLLNSAIDALAEATRRLALYSVRRDVIRIKQTFDDAASLQLGVAVTIVLPRFGYDSGRIMMVIGREDNLSDESVVLTLWG